MMAVSAGRAEVAQVLLKAGANPRMRDGMDNTLLMMAANTGNSSLIKLFLELGLDVNANNDSGRTALMYAVRQENLVGLKTLLDAPGIQVHQKDRFGKTAMDYFRERWANSTSETRRKMEEMLTRKINPPSPSLTVSSGG
jgi:ankyrin repeat protein